MRGFILTLFLVPERVKVIKDVDFERLFYFTVRFTIWSQRKHQLLFYEAIKHYFKDKSVKKYVTYKNNMDF
ncbi:hypothetical protein NQ314_007765 [Rhamnusium bicolor]|uniref:Uncharacterized protein n=1 Tax=Rhamnusium bicolor TaxID=1586634 RepID=A0AAV8YJN4_9CUCU|nr:hypothetical protein NQ314_007765 [Rhamnusium bicolor]